MLNQNHNVHKRTNSKILLIILCIFGLLFSWSCSCKNRVTGPGNDGLENGRPGGGQTDNDGQTKGTFSMSASTNNVVTSIVKSSTTSISDIKIAFTEANNHDYTMDYTVEDSETDEAKKLTKADFQLANKVLTAKDSVATKVKLVDSSTGPAEKTITINFTFKANDTSLKNNTQTLSVEVKLTHAQVITQGDEEIPFVKEVLTGSSFTVRDANNTDPNADFPIFSYKSYDKDNKYYIYNNQAIDDASFSYDMNESMDRLLSRIKRQSQYGVYYTDVIFNNDIAAVAGDDQSITFSLNFVMTGDYEMADSKITIKAQSLAAGTKWVIPPAAK